MKKNFTKILLAVPAFVIAASCAKEIAPVQEATPADEIAGKVFTTEFEGVKTTLDADRTPVWVEGDAIGVTTADDANVQCPLLNVEKGTFNAANIQGTAPYYAVYPYSEDNTFEGDVLTATIPSVQTLSNGQNVAPGALVSACKSNSTTLSFKNCVSLMQIEIPIENVKKVKVEATTTGEKLSGAFTMNLEELNPAAAAEGAENYVELLPSGESFAIGTYYISVIPGTIKAVKITFTNTEDKEVSVSKSATTNFARSNGINMGSFFKYEISTADELIKWAAQNAKYTAWDVVNLNADITLTAEQAKKYVEAHEFKGTFNGNNHKISGLKTPLFGNLRGAIVKDLEIEANIVANGKQASPFKGTDYGVGILAHYAYPDQGQASPVLSNIKTYGSIEVKELNVTHNFMFGGVVGASNGTPLVDCENNATVTFTNGTTGTTTSTTLNMGGVIGAAQNTTTSDLTRCVNKGKVTLAGFSGAGSPVAAGCVGLITQAVEITGCKNEAEVEVASTVGNISFIAAGLAGNFTGAATVDGCENSGAVNANAPAGKYLVIGGLVGSLKPDAGVVKNSENKGVVTVNTNAANRSDIGGVIAYTGTTNMKGGYYVQNVTNSGNIVVNGTSGSSSDQFRIGGIIGNLSYGGIIGKDKDGNDTPCYNKANITVKSPQTKHIRIAGGIGSTTNVKTNVYNIHNTGDITIEITGGNTCAQIDGAGIVGYLGTGPFTIANCSSKCNIVKTGTVTNNYIAEFLGRSGTGTGPNYIQDCQIGGSVDGTVITNDNKETLAYKAKGAGAITVTNITLAE